MRGPAALWQSIAAAQSLSKGVLGFVSLVHTLQIVALALVVLGVADPSDNRSANAFLDGLTMAAEVLTGSRLDEVFDSTGLVTHILGLVLSFAAVGFVGVVMSGLDVRTWCVKIRTKGCPTKPLHGAALSFHRAFRAHAPGGHEMGGVDRSTGQGLRWRLQSAARWVLQGYYLLASIPVASMLLRPLACFDDNRNGVRAAFSGGEPCFSQPLHLALALLGLLLLLPHCLLSSLGAVSLAIDGTADSPSSNTKAHGTSNWNFWLSYELLLVALVNLFADLRPELSWVPLGLVTASTTAWTIIFTVRMERVLGPVNASVMALLAGIAWMCWAALIGMWVAPPRHAYANAYLLALLGLPLVLASGTYFAAAWRMYVLGQKCEQLTSEDDLALWGYHRLQCAVEVARSARAMRMELTAALRQSEVLELERGEAPRNDRGKGVERGGRPARRGRLASTSSDTNSSSAQPGQGRRGRRRTMAPGQPFRAAATSAAERDTDGSLSDVVERARGRHRRLSADSVHSFVHVMGEGDGAGHSEPDEASALLADEDDFVALTAGTTEEGAHRLVYQAARDLALADAAFARLEHLHPRSPTALLHCALYYSSPVVRHSATLALRYLSKVSQMSMDSATALLVAARQSDVLARLFTEDAPSRQANQLQAGPGRQEGAATALQEGVSIAAAGIAQELARVIGRASIQNEARLRMVRSAQLQAIHTSHDVWDHLLRPTVDFGVLHALVAKFAEARMQVEQHFQSLLADRPSDAGLMRAYAAYLANTVNDNESASALRDDAARFASQDSSKWAEYGEVLDLRRLASFGDGPATPSAASGTTQLVAKRMDPISFIPAFAGVRPVGMRRRMSIAEVQLGGALLRDIHSCMGQEVDISHVKHVLPMAAGTAVDDALLTRTLGLSASCDEISQDLLEELLNAGSSAQSHTFFVISAAEGDVGTILRADYAACQLLGKSKADLEGSHITSFLPAPYSTLPQSMLEEWVHDCDAWLGRWFMGALLNAAGHLVPVRGSCFETPPQRSATGGNSLTLQPRLVLVLQPLFLSGLVGMAMVRGIRVEPRKDSLGATGPDGQPVQEEAIERLEMVHTDLALSRHLGLHRAGKYAGDLDDADVMSVARWLPTIAMPGSRTLQTSDSASVGSAGSGESDGVPGCSSDTCVLPTADVSAWEGVPLVRGAGQAPEAVELITMPAVSPSGSGHHSGFGGVYASVGEGATHISGESGLGMHGVDAGDVRQAYWFVVLANHGDHSSQASPPARAAGHKRSSSTVVGRTASSALPSSAVLAQLAAEGGGDGGGGEGAEASMRHRLALRGVVDRLKPRHLRSARDIISNLRRTLLSTVVGVGIIFPVLLIAFVPSVVQNFHAATDVSLEVQGLLDTHMLLHALGRGADAGYLPSNSSLYEDDFGNVAAGLDKRHMRVVEDAASRARRLVLVNGWSMRDELDSGTVGLLSAEQAQPEPTTWARVAEYMSATLRFLRSSGDPARFASHRQPLGPTAMFQRNLDPTLQQHITAGVHSFKDAIVADEASVALAMVILLFTCVAYVLVARCCLLGPKLYRSVQELVLVKNQPLHALMSVSPRRVAQFKARAVEHMDAFIRENQHMLSASDDAFAEHAVLLSGGDEEEGMLTAAMPSSSLSPARRPRFGGGGHPSSSAHSQSSSFMQGSSALTQADSAVPSGEVTQRKVTDSSYFTLQSRLVGGGPSLLLAMGYIFIMVLGLGYIQRTSESLHINLATSHAAIAQAQYSAAVMDFLHVGDARAAAASPLAQRTAEQGGLNISAFVLSRAEAAARVESAERVLRAGMDRIMYGGSTGIPPGNGNAFLALLGSVSDTLAPLVLDEAYSGLLLRSMCSGFPGHTDIPATAEFRDNTLVQLRKTYNANCSTAYAGILAQTGLAGAVHLFTRQGQQLLRAVNETDDVSTFAALTSGSGGAELYRSVKEFVALDHHFLRHGMWHLHQLHHVQRGEVNAALVRFLLALCSIISSFMLLLHFVAAPYSMFVGRGAVQSVHALLLLPTTSHLSRSERSQRGAEAIGSGRSAGSSSALLGRASTGGEEGIVRELQRFARHGEVVMRTVQKVLRVQASGGGLKDGGLAFSKADAEAGVSLRDPGDQARGKCCGCCGAASGQGVGAVDTPDATHDGWDSHLSSDDSDGHV